MESELLKLSRFFFMLVRERFNGEKIDTYNKFIALLAKHIPNAANGSIETMFTEVKTLFASDQYLINKFANFVQHYRKINNISSHVEKEIPLSKSHQLIKNAVDLLNNVRCSLNDQDQFKQFINIVARFRKHKQVETVREKAYKVLKKHPLLIREWSAILAEANVGKGSKAENYHELMFDFEHAMHKTDLLFHRALCVKDSAKRLMSENSDKDPMERIDVGVYFSALDVKCVKKLKGCSHMLMNKFKLRGKAVRVAKRILYCAKKKIAKLIKCWSPQMKKLALKRHVEEYQIPVFDWHNNDEEV